jgi:hypothetical protein
MSGEYAPGNSHFWVFFAVSVTFIGLIFGITYTLRFWNKETSGGVFRALREGARPSPKVERSTLIRRWLNDSKEKITMQFS